MTVRRTREVTFGWRGEDGVRYPGRAAREYSIFRILNMNTERDARAAPAEILKAIAHPTRLAVLEILRDGEQCVCHMEAILGVRQASLSQQLMILREAGLVDVRRDGLNIFYHVVKPQIFGLVDASYAASGKGRQRIVHKHGPTSCPCPKCAVQRKERSISVSVRR